MLGPPSRRHGEVARANCSAVLAIALIAALGPADGGVLGTRVAWAGARDGDPAAWALNPGDSAAWSRAGGGVACIEYNLPKAGHVHVRVYDAAGHEVAHPVNEWQAAGRHITMFAFGPAPNQVFRYRVKCGRRISSGRIETGP